MRRSDAGEFELVMGNKQLLAVFFIMILLLCVFFSMGYIVGRNTAPSEEVAQTGAPVEVQPAGKPAEDSQASSEVADGRESSRAEPAETASGSPDTNRVAEPEPGQSFLQVAATDRPEAEVLLEALRKRGFEARLAPVPDQDLIRVLVGPVEGADQLSKTRASLQEAGFKPFTRTY